MQISVMSKEQRYKDYYDSIARKLSTIYKKQYDITIPFYVFKRISLDFILGCRWESKVRKPAIKYLKPETLIKVVANYKILSLDHLELIKQIEFSNKLRQETKSHPHIKQNKTLIDEEIINKLKNIKNG